MARLLKAKSWGYFHTFRSSSTVKLEPRMLLFDVENAPDTGLLALKPKVDAESNSQITFSA
ncbi:hypothetical protein AtubIFM61612_009725 [Aspergillus tubingensis]|nr:hypothetical protein AtubIFM61612_009725 [Aspergillus tubingensis]